MDLWNIECICEFLDSVDIANLMATCRELWGRRPVVRKRITYSADLDPSKFINMEIPDYLGGPVPECVKSVTVSPNYTIPIYYSIYVRMICWISGLRYNYDDRVIADQLTKVERLSIHGERFPIHYDFSNLRVLKISCMPNGIVDYSDLPRLEELTVRELGVCLHPPDCLWKIKAQVAPSVNLHAYKGLRSIHIKYASLGNIHQINSMANLTEIILDAKLRYMTNDSSCLKKYKSLKTYGVNSKDLLVAGINYIDKLYVASKAHVKARKVVYRYLPRLWAFSESAKIKEDIGNQKIYSIPPTINKLKVTLNGKRITLRGNDNIVRFFK